MNRTSAAALATLSLLIATPTVAQQNFDSVQIRSEELAPGVAVLFGVGGNIGVSHGEDGTILIDDQFAPLTEKIEAAVEALGAQPVGYVINTHWHFDHTGGNENLGKQGATIFAHHNVRSRLASGGTVLGNMIPPAAKEALPIVTFDQGIRFHLNGDTIDVIHTGGGHTDGDSIVRWREKNILHMGDLFMTTDSFPFIDQDSGGNVYSLMSTLDLAISLTDSETKVIPGHGPMSDKAGLMAFRAMIGQSVESIEALHAAGQSLEEAIAANPLEEFGRTTGFIGPERFITAIWPDIEAR